MTTLEIVRIEHIGIRVVDAARSEAFYEKLGFEAVFRNEDADVVILENATGIEINLIVNADPAAAGANVLQDEVPKRTGYTHVALGIASMSNAIRRLGELGIDITEGPVRLGNALSVFVRDPDRNVIELRETS